MKIVVTGLIATYPLGGVSWDYIAYVAGFARLGHEVFYLEDTGNWFYDPTVKTFTDEVSFNIGYLLDAFEYAGLHMQDHWSVASPDGVYHGAPQTAVERFCGKADLFLNISGSCWLRERYQGARRNAFLDSDPCYSQAKLLRWTGPQMHDCFFTFAENIGHPTCQVPLCGLQWHATRQPIVLDQWAPHFDPNAEAFTTVMSWKTDVALPSLDGVAYGGKDVEFRKFLDLPGYTPVRLEVAIAGGAPFDDLRRRGWHLTDPQAKSGTMAAYRDYLAQSRGEWSVAKNAYVASRSGWFSTRSAAYLALGKPVVVQDTGFSTIYPTGSGLFAFTTLQDAVDGLAAVNADYRWHCDAARALAEQEFDSDRVLTRLLQDAGLA
jgi:hypothetical protein